jgi:hypothetical protein
MKFELTISQVVLTCSMLFAFHEQYYVIPDRSYAIVNGKTGIMLPLMEFFTQTIINLAVLLEHLQEVGTKQLCQRADIDFRHQVENKQSLVQAMT